jgi:ribonuclease HI
MKNNLRIYCDGGSRGNKPDRGKCAIGIIITDEENKILSQYSEYIGNGTNNWAEYKAVIKGLKLATKYSTGSISCISDSQLLINQLNGIYQVRSNNLIPLFQEIKNLEKKFEHVKYHHVTRTNEYIKKADFLLNNTLDRISRK